MGPIITTPTTDNTTKLAGAISIRPTSRRRTRARNPPRFAAGLAATCTRPGVKTITTNKTAAAYHDEPYYNQHHPPAYQAGASYQRHSALEDYPPPAGRQYAQSSSGGDPTGGRSLTTRDAYPPPPPPEHPGANYIPPTRYNPAQMHQPQQPLAPPPPPRPYGHHHHSISSTTYAPASSHQTTYGDRGPPPYTQQPPDHRPHLHPQQGNPGPHHPYPQSASHQHHDPSMAAASRSSESTKAVNEYLKRVQFSDSDRDKLMASYLTCDGLLNDNDHCLERLSCEFSDPHNIERANKLDRAVSSILLGHILINTYIPNAFKLRLKSASLFGYTQSGKCSKFACGKLAGKHEPGLGNRLESSNSLDGEESRASDKDR
ncbi:Hypothetical predicted protein [Olea europaea subsp. europaea]|uniref:Uncharacterized protein n=1 Tax=Olea europaea subsp. europaea TaxID=158383 RepID=A0A8S0V4W2_OLEEU|nr:Hypothetical predicted protein [Olea europaea subsp. europaea]